MEVDLSHIARLARLRLDARERERFGAQIAGFMALFETIPALGEEAAAPEAPDCSALRPDVHAPSLPAQELLSAAPQTEAGCFAVPRTVD